MYELIKQYLTVALFGRTLAVGMSNSKTLAELSEESGIPARTIRFYIARGLLDGPVKAGRGAVYTAEHLARLETIKKLQAEGRMLAEIAHDLNGGPAAPAASPPAPWWQYAIQEDVMILGARRRESMAYEADSRGGGRLRLPLAGAGERQYKEKSQMSTTASFAPISAATGETVKLSMQRLWLTGQVLPAGGRLLVQHVFRSEEDKPIEVIYSFPLPSDAALRRFRITGEGFEAHSELKETEAAVKAYEEGIARGSLADARAAIRRRRGQSHGGEHPAEGDGDRRSGDPVRRGTARRRFPLPFSVYAGSRLPPPGEGRDDGGWRRRNGTAARRIRRRDPAPVLRGRHRRSTRSASNFRW